MEFFALGRVELEVCTTNQTHEKSVRMFVNSVSFRPSAICLACSLYGLPRILSVIRIKREMQLPYEYRRNPLDAALPVSSTLSHHQSACRDPGNNKPLRINRIGCQSHDSPTNCCVCILGNCCLIALSLEQYTCQSQLSKAALKNDTRMSLHLFLGMARSSLFPSISRVQDHSSEAEDMLGTQKV